MQAKQRQVTMNKVENVKLRAKTMRMKLEMFCKKMRIQRLNNLFPDKVSLKPCLLRQKTPQMYPKPTFLKEIMKMRSQGLRHPNFTAIHCRGATNVRRTLIIKGRLDVTKAPFMREDSSSAISAKNLIPTDPTSKSM